MVEVSAGEGLAAVVGGHVGREGACGEIGTTVLTSGTGEEGLDLAEVKLGHVSSCSDLLVALEQRKHLHISLPV